MRLLVAAGPPLHDAAAAMHVLQECVGHDGLMRSSRDASSPAEWVDRRLGLHIIAVEQSAAAERAKGIWSVAGHESWRQRGLAAEDARAVEHGGVGRVLIQDGLAMLIELRLQAFVLRVAEERCM